MAEIAAERAVLSLVAGQAPFLFQWAWLCIAGCLIGRKVAVPVVRVVASRVDRLRVGKPRVGSGVKALSVLPAG